MSKIQDKGRSVPGGLSGPEVRRALRVQVVASRDSRRGRWCPRLLMPYLSPRCLVIALRGPHHRHRHRLPGGRVSERDRAPSAWSALRGLLPQR